MENSQKINIGHKISPDMLDDMACRFIINVPIEERSNLIRICFQIELAHWFYLDFFCNNTNDNTNFTPCGLKQFAIHLFNHIPFLRKNLPQIDKILDDWKQYKLSVPTYGAILLTEDLEHVLLVQSYWAKSSWGFPKGKVNENEDQVHCAIREVFEETGYDIKNLISPYEYIESNINDQHTRLYIVRDVPYKTSFTPRTRNEIKCCEWFLLDYLPTNKNDTISKTNLGINSNSFFMIIPFVKRLKRWVNDKRLLASQQKQFNPINSLNKNVCYTPNVTTSTATTQSAHQQDSINNTKRQRHRSTGDLEKFTNNYYLNATTTSTPITTTVTHEMVELIPEDISKDNVNVTPNQTSLTTTPQQITNKQKTKANNYKRKLFKMSSPGGILQNGSQNQQQVQQINMNVVEKINNITKAAKQNKNGVSNGSNNNTPNNNGNNKNKNILNNSNNNKNIKANEKNNKKIVKTIDFTDLDKWSNFKFISKPIIEIF